MHHDLTPRLVIAVASSALFDLRESDRVYREEGLLAYRKHQIEREEEILPKGEAFAFIERLLGLNAIAPELKPVDVILLSRNTADTGLRIFNSIEHYRLPMTRAAFCGGRDPFTYMGPLNAKLFLSANAEDVRAAVAAGLPAGQILRSETTAQEEPSGGELRLAFDFDGVLADDSSERVYREKQLSGFLSHEERLSQLPHAPGPLKPFLDGLAQLQKLEQQRVTEDASYRPLLRTAIVTARAAPAHQRVIRSLRSWGLSVDEIFFLGGIDKGRIMSQFRPHIFFDDQLCHLDSIRAFAPSVHIPFGIANSTAD